MKNGNMFGFDLPEKENNPFGFGGFGQNNRNEIPQLKKLMAIHLKKIIFKNILFHYLLLQ